MTEFYVRMLKCVQQNPPKRKVSKPDYRKCIVVKSMVLGDRDLLLILEFFAIVMYGESSENWTKNPVAKYYHHLQQSRFSGHDHYMLQVKGLSSRLLSGHK